MLVRIYWLIWALLGVVSLIFFAAGELTPLVLVTLGFFAFGMTFMGMMGVLPTIVGHATHPAPVKAEPARIPERKEIRAEAFGRLKSA
ncbi:MAG: hypothetical protein ABI646_11105 [Acidobacteriota bacterium]